MSARTKTVLIEVAALLLTIVVALVAVGFVAWLGLVWGGVA